MKCDTEQNDVIVDVLDGTTIEAAHAYLNTIRKIYDLISVRIKDIDWRLGRVSDEYCSTNFEDGVAIANDVNELIKSIVMIQLGIDKLTKSVIQLEEKNTEKKK